MFKGFWMKGVPTRVRRSLRGSRQAYSMGKSRRRTRREAGERKTREGVWEIPESSLTRPLGGASCLEKNSLAVEPYLKPTQVNRLKIVKARRERTLRN